MSEERAPRPRFRDVRRALRVSNLTGSFVLGKYALAPYMACSHGCAYCDGRAERYWVEGDFERDIVVRRNLPQILDAELRKLREPGFVSLGSGITDAYQPIESSTRLTKACAEAIERSGRAATIITKSALVLRDLPVLRRVNDAARCLVVVSLVHGDDATRARFEPGAASVAARLQVLRAFRDAGCATGVLAMPLLPFITDDEETLTTLYDELARIGVDFIQPGVLTLRPGRQKEFFLARLRDARPDLTERYLTLYADERASGMPNDTYTRETTRRALAHNRRVGIPHLVPHEVYRDVLLPYDEAHVLLEHMVELYAAHGVDTRRLRAARDRYHERLVARKSAYNRHRSWDYRELAEEIFAPGTLEEWVENDRLAAFLRSIVVERRLFDYASLSNSPASSRLKPSSSSVGTARSAASSSFDPGSSPTTT